MHVDRGILYLLYKYEVNGVSTATYRYPRLVHVIWVVKYYIFIHRPYLWGSAAEEHYQQKQEVGWLLWKQPGMQEVIGLMDRKQLHLSAANFPIDVELEVNHHQAV